jgi:hypothetical protein
MPVLPGRLVVRGVEYLTGGVTQKAKGHQSSGDFVEASDEKRPVHAGKKLRYILAGLDHVRSED